MCSRFCGVWMAGPHVPACTSSSDYRAGHHFRVVFTPARLGSREYFVQPNARNVGVRFTIPGGSLGSAEASRANTQDCGPSPLFIQYLEPTRPDCAKGKRSETVGKGHDEQPRCIQLEGKKGDPADRSDVPLRQHDDNENLSGDLGLGDEERPSESAIGVQRDGSGFHGLEQEELPSQEVVFKYTQTLRGLDEGLSEDGLEDFSSLKNEVELDIGNAVDLEVDFLEELFPASRGLLTGRKVFSVGRQSFQSLQETSRMSDEQQPEDSELESEYMLEDESSDLENEASDFEDETSDVEDELFDGLHMGETALHEVEEIARLPIAFGDYGVKEPRIANQQLAHLSQNEPWGIIHDMDMPRDVGRGSSEKYKTANPDAQQHVSHEDSDGVVPLEGPPLSVSELESDYMLEDESSDLENEASDFEDETSDVEDAISDGLGPVDMGGTALHEVEGIARLPTMLVDGGVKEPRIANQQLALLSQNVPWGITMDMPSDVGRGSSGKYKTDNPDAQQHVSHEDSDGVVRLEGATLSGSERLRCLSIEPTAPAALSIVEELVQELLSVGKDITNSVYDVMESYLGKLSTMDANNVIERLGDEKHFRQAFAVFEWMRSQDPILVNSRSYSLILPLLGTAGMIKQAILIFENMKADFRSIQTYNSYIGLLLSCGREDDLQAVLTDMESRGIKKDGVTFSLFINFAVKKKRGLKEVLRIYNTMTQNQVPPNTAVFGSVVKAFCDEGRLDDALVFVNEMETSGRPPNIIIYNTLIDAFGKANMLDVAEWLLSEVKRRGLRLHVSTYNALMNVYGRQGRFEVAEDLFTEMQDAGLKPDIVTYTTLINAYAKRKKSEKAANVFAKMRKAGIFPNVNAYTALIHAYSEDGWHTKAAMAFENMQREGISPTVQTYTALLEGYRVAGDIEQVIRIWREMKAVGCKGTRITFNTLVDAFAKQGRYQEARDVVSEYAVLGYRPDNMTYNMLINAYGRGGNHEKIPDLVKEMLKLGLRPDSYTYCTIVYAFLRVRDFKNVFRWFDKMLQRKQKPDPATYRKLADLVKKKRQIQQESDRKSVLGQIAAKELLLSGKAAPKPGGKKEFWKTKKPHKTSGLRLKSKPKQAPK